jgi:hypothetical protein
MSTISYAFTLRKGQLYVFIFTWEDGYVQRLLLTVQCPTIERYVLISYLETPHLQEHIGHTMHVSFWLLRLFETFFAPRNI